MRFPPQLLPAAAALFWSGNLVLGRAVHTEIPPIGLAFWRWVVAGLVLLPFAWPHLKTGWPLIRAHARLFVWMGAIAVGGFNTFLYLALATGPAITAGLMQAAVPIAIIAVGWLGFRDRVTAGQALGIALGLVGVVAVLAQGDLAVLLSLQVGENNAWMLLAVAVWAIYTVYLRRLPQGVHPAATLSVMIWVGVLVLAPFYAWEVSTGRTVPVTLVSAASVGYTALGASLAAWLCWNAGVARLGAARTAPFANLVPILGIGLAMVLLGERPEGFHLVGAVCVFGGILLAELSARRAAAT